MGESVVTFLAMSLFVLLDLVVAFLFVVVVGVFDVPSIIFVVPVVPNEYFTFVGVEAVAPVICMLGTYVQHGGHVHEV